VVFKSLWGLGAGNIFKSASPYVSWKMKLSRKLSLTILLVVSISINISVLFVIEGPLWGLFCLTLWILISVLTIFFLLQFLSRIISKMKMVLMKGKGDTNRLSSCIWRLVIAGMCLSLSFYPFMSYMTHLKAESNKVLLEMIVSDIVKDAKTDREKVTKILEWFDRSKRNMYNYYYLNKKGVINLELLPNIRIFLGEPYIGIRVFNDRDSLWILTSRYGHCGEYALLFRDMANAAGIEVRRIRCLGENHEWNEVKLNGSWVPVDATAVNLPLRDGFVTFDFMERKVAGDMRTRQGNVSYVYAEYLNGTIVDVTSSYTNLTNITILVVDDQGMPVPDARVEIFSHNRGRKWSTGLTKVTDSLGVCKFNIGGGDYTFEVKKGTIIPLTGRKREKFSEGISYNITIKLHKDWTYVISAIIITLLIILAVTYKIKNKKRVNENRPNCPIW